MKYLVLLLCSLLSGLCIGLELSPFKATYKIGIPNMTVAEMTVIVKHKEDKFLYQSTVEPKGVIEHILNIQAHSYSKIIKKGDHWLPLVYEKEVSDKNKKQHYRFDWKNYKAEVIYKGKQYDLTITKDTVDENTFQLKLRDDVVNTLDTDFEQSYTLLSDGRLKERRFVKQAEEVIKIEQGKFNAIRIERYKNETPDQVYWISPEHNYLPIKILKLDSGKIKTTLTLRNLIPLPN